MTTEKQQNRADRQFNEPTDKTKGGGKDQMQQGGNKKPGQQQGGDHKTVQPDSGVSRSSTR